MVVMASAWKQISYNFVFFIAGMQAIPGSLIEAAAMDGASPFRRFWKITLPLLSPTLFFVTVMNIIYYFFEILHYLYTWNTIVNHINNNKFLIVFKLSNLFIPFE